jgi:outer membrane protein TolC
MLFGMIFFAGCAHQRGNKDIEMKVTSEQLHQIEPLELKAAPREDEPAQPKTEEPTPAELELSLEQCRAWALENNLDLKVQLINPAIAAERVSQEEAQFESTFLTNVNYSKTNMPQPTTLVGSSIEDIQADLGVTVPLRTGGKITLDLVDDRVETNSIFSTLNPYYDPRFSASISQPLLRNAGMRVNEHYIRIAEYDSRITDAETKLKAIRVMADVEDAYWRLYAARRMLDVRKQQYELAKTLHEQTEAFVKVGSKAQIELIRTRAGLAQKLEGIISAENDLRDTERTLKGMLNKEGLEMETTTELIPTTEPNPVHYEIQSKEMVTKAMDNRMEMLELELQLAKDSDNIEYFKNQSLPAVSMQYTYNINGLGPTRSDSYDMLRDNRFHDNRVGLFVSIPLGDKAAKSKLREAEYGRAQRLATRDNGKAQIKKEVLTQIGKLEAKWQSILAARQTTILMDQQYQAEKRQYELGMRTSTDVLNAQTSLAEAQRAEICALAEYQIALVDLAYATGTVLGAAKVEWEPYVLK